MRINFTAVMFDVHFWPLDGDSRVLIALLRFKNPVV